VPPPPLAANFSTKERAMIDYWLSLRFMLAAAVLATAGGTLL
jgi:hypothetical protein